MAIIKYRLSGRNNTAHYEQRVEEFDKNLIEEIRTEFKIHGDIRNVLRCINWNTLTKTMKNLQDEENVKTAPGSDMVTIEEYISNAETNIERLLKAIRERTYSPKPARRIYIPKPNGKKRPITIMSTEDKIVQKLITDYVLTPIGEEIFTNDSFGYRPNRGTRDAVDEIKRSIEDNDHLYVLEADIKGFFDNVNRELVMKIIRKYIKDKNAIELINSMIDVELVENYKKIKTTGIIQGGIVSPVLANFYLDEILDSWIYKEHKGIKLIRYADDFIVLGKKKEELEKLYIDIKNRFKDYNLEYSEEKTGIRCLYEDKVHFLGFSIWTENRDVKVCLDEDKLERKYKKIEEILNIDNLHTDLLKLTTLLHRNLTREEYARFLHDYICWINNFLIGEYKYYRGIENYIQKMYLLYDKAIEVYKSNLDPLLVRAGYECGESDIYDPISYKMRMFEDQLKEYPEGIRIDLRNVRFNK